MRKLIMTMTLAAAAAYGCSSDDDGGNAEGGTSGASGGSGSPLAEDCDGRCQAKASDCGAPSDIAIATCDDICSMNVTEEQATCLEDSECTALAGAISGEPICGIGQGPSSTSGSTTNASTSGPATTSTTTSTTSNPDTAVDGGTLGDPCDCGDPTGSCQGTENGCQFSLSGESYICLVNSGDTSEGFCTQSCDPNDDQCPEGGSCTEFTNYLTMEPFFVCQ